MKEIKVGSIVVIMDLFESLKTPIRANSEHSEDHPCRCRVLSIGRINCTVEATGGPWRNLRMYPGKDAAPGRYAVPLETARNLYRSSLVRHANPHANYYADSL
jgi:hypothetical protein